MRRILLVLVAGFSIAAAPVFGAAPPPAARTIPTLTIGTPHELASAPDILLVAATPDEELDSDGDAPDAAEESDTDAPASGIPTEIPVVEYDFSKLPTPVARLREQIIEAARSGDLEKLRPIIDANGEPPRFSAEDADDFIDYLKKQSGDPEGREILAILWEVLDAGYVHVDAGEPGEMYVWPYFAQYPVSKLTPPQLVELFRLVYAGDYEDMVDYGLYTWFRAGLTPDGRWAYFFRD